MRFLLDAENHACEAGLYVLGQADSSEPFISGEFGAGLRIFEEPRSASRLYLHIPKIGRGVIHYVAFSPLNKLSFDPDLLIILAEHRSDRNPAPGHELQDRGDVGEQIFTLQSVVHGLYIYPYLPAN